MTIIKTYAKLNRKIRHLNRIIKVSNNEAKVFHAEAEYHQAVIDNIYAKFPELNIKEIK